MADRIGRTFPHIEQKPMRKIQGLDEVFSRHALDVICDILSGSQRNDSLNRHLMHFGQHLRRIFSEDPSVLELGERDAKFVELVESLIQNTYLDGRFDNLTPQRGSAVTFVVNALAKVEEKRALQAATGNEKRLNMIGDFKSFRQGVSAFEQAEWERYRGGGSSNVYAGITPETVTRLHFSFSESERSAGGENVSNVAFLYLIKNHLLIKDSVRGMSESERTEREREFIEDPSLLSNMKSQDQALLYSFGHTNRLYNFHFVSGSVPFTIMAGRFLQEQRRLQKEKKTDG